MVRGFGLLVALVLAGCGGGDGESGEKPNQPPSEAGASSGGGADSGEPAGPVCEAGRQVECACANGGKGVQVCADDGEQWGACQCEGSKPAEPEVPPSEACGERLDLELPREQACPAGKQAIFFECPDGYVESGLCARNQDDSFTCCPEA